MIKFIRLILITAIFGLANLLYAQSTNLDQLMANTMNKFFVQNKAPGITVAIYYKGQDYYFNYGFADKEKQIPVTNDTIFELASITKIFVTTLLALEVQTGHVKLSDAVTNYIPQLSNTSGLPIDRVRVINLATHTASFPRQMEQFGIDKGDIAGLINELKVWHPKAGIGTQYKYSNIGFGFLGLVLEGATNESLPALIKDKITSPLNMSHTFFDIPEENLAYQAQGYRFNNVPAPFYVPANLLGGGALRSSAADLLIFMKANLGIKTTNASAQLLSAMQLAQKAYFKVRPQFVMGLGWQRVRHGQGLLITKNGANQGFNTFIGFSPSQQLGVVVLTNQAKGNATLLGNMILSRLLSVNR